MYKKLYVRTSEIDTQLNKTTYTAGKQIQGWCSGVHMIKIYEIFNHTVEMLSLAIWYAEHASTRISTTFQITNEVAFHKYATLPIRS